MKNSLRTVALLTSLTASLGAIAGEHSCPVGNEAYVVDSRGYVVHNNYGECVRTSAWTKELAIKECDPDLFPVEEAAAPAPAPAPAPTPAPQQVMKTKALDAGALFAHDKSSLSAQGQAELDALVTDLKQMDRVDNVTVTGHTDSSGAEDYNMALSMRRATTVKNYLVGKGINADLITTKGMGESQPVTSNATKEGRAKNRRVEITIQGSEIVVQ